MGVDEDSSSSSLLTDDLGIYGNGKYIIKQGVGGSGFGLDIGVASRPLNGWNFGLSIMGIGGAFILVPAMIYIIKMPTKLVPGTSLFVTIFVSVVEIGRASCRERV